NPTASPEQLGAIMRGLFADEVAEQRRLAAEAQATDLNPWVEQLTTQSQTTVSYALAHMPLFAPPDEPATQMVDRPLPAPRAAAAPGPRRRVGVIAAIGITAGLIAGSALAWSFGRNRDGGGETAAAEPSAAPAEPAHFDSAGAGAPATLSANGEPAAVRPERSAGVAGANSKDDADVIQMPPDELDRDVKPVADARPVRRTQRPATKPAVRKPEPPRPTDPPALSRAEVEGRFKTLSSEYRRFKGNYGPVLESQWAGLLSFAQNEAKQSDDKLRLLDKRITAFRAKMKSHEQ
ncbi:MAG TPA: hypothetical protein VL172_17205, partial [Kofleriaceae bacterium]|nr:hypothetical protein [Kofleriaceae bacterium]